MNNSLFLLRDLEVMGFGSAWSREGYLVGFGRREPATKVPRNCKASNVQSGKRMVEKHESEQIQIYAGDLKVMDNPRETSEERADGR